MALHPHGVRWHGLVVANVDGHPVVGRGERLAGKLRPGRDGLDPWTEALHSLEVLPNKTGIVCRLSRQILQWELALVANEVSHERLPLVE